MILKRILVSLDRGHYSPFTTQGEEKKEKLKEIKKDGRLLSS
jgi:hypothetical protein